MIGSHTSAQTLVFADKVFAFVTSTGSAPREMSLRIDVDEQLVWQSIEPGWRGLSIGFDGGCVYWWSARRLVVWSPDIEVATDLKTDDDILVVFRDGDISIVVCESSVLLVTHSGVTRLELDRAVVAAHRTGHVLVLRDDEGRLAQVRFDRDSLDLL